MFSGDLERAVLETITYSDIFEYPLTSDELYRYLPIRAESEKLPIVIESLSAWIGRRDDYIFLAGRENIVEIRKKREINSKQLISRALRYGGVLGSLPFVRMVALTGSLAVLNSSGKADFDYMLVTVPGRVWTARVFALMLNRFTSLSGYTICPNLIISENRMEWGVKDLYSARELYQMIPITGLDVYQTLMKANAWARDFFPNATPSLQEEQSSTKQRSSYSLLAMTESLLSGKLGDRFEQWEMDRKIARFSKQTGFGEETIFNAEICQGNFNHHRKWTNKALEEKLNVIARRADGRVMKRIEVQPDEAITDKVMEKSPSQEIASLSSVARNDEARV